MIVSSSPHLHSGNSTQKVMLDVIIALFPALVASVIIFGINALVLTCVCVASCVLFEYIARKIMKREQTVLDLSAVVTGMLLAFNLPVTLNPFFAIIGSAVAIIIVKQMFGGIGQNFVNPALTARIVLMVSFPALMSNWIEPFYYKSADSIDALTTATTLSSEIAKEDIPSLLQMFFGVRGGCLGETCAFALILGGIYLVVRKVITPLIPLVYVGTVAVFGLILGEQPLMYILSGGLMLGAIFMATDYTTSPLTNKGKVIFAIGCGLLTVVIRQFGSLPEGVSYSIVIMNILVPHIEKLTRPTAFGKIKVKKEKA